MPDKKPRPIAKVGWDPLPAIGARTEAGKFVYEVNWNWQIATGTPLTVAKILHSGRVYSVWKVREDFLNHDAPRFQN
jgi:hypothetical protein